MGKNLFRDIECEMRVLDERLRCLKSFRCLSCKEVRKMTMKCNFQYGDERIDKLCCMLKSGMSISECDYEDCILIKIKEK